MMLSILKQPRSAGGCMLIALQSALQAIHRYMLERRNDVLCLFG
ncbi:hypothetical protein [Xylella taiwanensis]|nr:hypothetical protein [Xylella taiwanensis]